MVMATMSKLVKQTSGGTVESVPNDDQFSEAYPTLWEWLTATQIADEFKKERPKLSIGIEGGYWRVSLSDAALECSLATLGNSFATAIESIDRLLLDADAPWQHWRKRGAKLRPIAPAENNP